MKIGSMNNPEKPLLEEIERIGSSGFDFIDLTLEPPMDPKVNTTQVMKLLEKFQLNIVGHTNPHLPGVFPLQSIQDASMDELIQTTNRLIGLGARYVTLHPYFDSTRKTPEALIEANLPIIRTLSDYCRRRGAYLMLENFIAPFDTPETFERILNEVPEIKVHLDIGHLHAYNELPKILGEFLDRFRHRIIHYHLHDNHGTKDEHLPIGAGTVPWPTIIKMIKDSGYDRTFTLEIFTPDLEYLAISKRKLEELWIEA